MQSNFKIRKEEGKRRRCLQIRALSLFFSSSLSLTSLFLFLSFFLLSMTVRNLLMSSSIEFFCWRVS